MAERAQRLWMFSVCLCDSTSLYLNTNKWTKGQAKCGDRWYIYIKWNRWSQTWCWMMTVWELPVTMPLSHKRRTCVIQGGLIWCCCLLVVTCAADCCWWWRMAGGYFPDKSSSRMSLDARLRRHAASYHNVASLNVHLFKRNLSLATHHVQFSELWLEGFRQGMYTYNRWRSQEASNNMLDYDEWGDHYILS